MSRRVLLLRAINVGARRIPMPALRDLLTESGIQDVRTHVRSGNVVVSSDEAPERLAVECRALISHRFGFDVPVVVRTGAELEAVVDHDPLGRGLMSRGSVAGHDVNAEARGRPDFAKRYWVSFLDRDPEPDRLERLRTMAQGDEHLHGHGRELYAWLPDGAARSKLATALAAPSRGVTATARNWATVTALLGLVRDAG